MEKKLITGETGCGKTYHAITQYPGSYAYIAPCKQLVYEVFQDYGTPYTKLETGDVYIDGTENFMGTYETLDPQDVVNYDRIIIDESHFLNDYERGGHLMDIINSCNKNLKDIFLLTATQNIDERTLKHLGFDIVELKPWEKVPEKIKIDEENFFENIHKGHPSIIFTKYAPDEYTKEYYMQELGLNEDEIAILSANNTGIERIKVQNDFRQGKIKLLICTNVLAQGINFPTTNILIEYNEWDGREVIEQKLGRLGRPTFCKDINEVYYCLSYKPEKQKSKELIHADREYTNDSDIAPNSLEKPYMPHMMIQSGKLLDYKYFKYCYQSIKELIETGNYYPEYKEELINAYNFLKHDRNELAKYLKNLHPKVGLTNGKGNNNIVYSTGNGESKSDLAQKLIDAGLVK